MIEQLLEIGFAVAIAITTIIDIKTKTIPVPMPLIIAGIGIGSRIWSQEISFVGIIAGLAPGVILLILAAVTHEQIGYGDALVVLAMGLYLEPTENISALMLGLVLAGVVAIVMLTILKKGRKYEIPFMPFLFIGTMIVRYVPI